MKASVLRTKSGEELKRELIDLSRQAFDLRMRHGSGQPARSSEMKALRRNVARVKTVINERRQQGKDT